MVSEVNPGEAAEAGPLRATDRIEIEPLIVSTSDRPLHDYLCDHFEIADPDRFRAWFSLGPDGVRCWALGVLVASRPWSALPTPK